jgi:hypothetical protein
VFWADDRRLPMIGQRPAATFSASCAYLFPSKLPNLLRNRPMNHCWLFLVATLAASPLMAQASGGEAATAITPGKYTIEARDTAKAFPPVPFELKNNGVFVITMTDGTFSGKMTMKDGTLTYSDQGCLDEGNAQREGTYVVRSERGGLWLDVKSDPCEDRGKSLASWIFRRVKK